MLKKFYEFHANKQMFYKKFQLVHTILSFGFIIFWVFAFKSSILDANNIPSGSMQPTLKIGDFLFVNKMRYSLRIPFTDIELFRIDSPKRGDIVTFIPPKDAGLQGKTLVKRVVGVPGDFLTVKNHEISVQRQDTGPNPIKYAVSSLNNNEKYKDVLKDMDCDTCDQGSPDYNLYHEQVIDPNSKKVIVEHFMLKNKSEHLIQTQMANPPLGKWPSPLGEGQYLVMGDNRDNSSDSREWGVVNIANIQGKVFMSYFSVNWQLSKRAVSDSKANPIFLLFDWITGNRPGTTIRWSRIGLRIF